MLGESLLRLIHAELARLVYAANVYPRVFVTVGIVAPLADCLLVAITSVVELSFKER